MPRLRATWTADCDAILIDTLFKERQSGRQTDNASFHTSAWTTAETLLAGTEAHTGGSPKTADGCKNRWNMLKKEYKEVKQIRELSGFGWDAERHLATADDNVWDTYCAAHPKQKKWRKTSFPLFDDIADLIEGTYATGKGVFRSGELPSNSSDDEEDDFINPVLLSQPSRLPSLSASTAITSSDTASDLPTPSAVATPLADAAGSGKRLRNGHRKSGSYAIEGMASSISRLADAFAADTVIPSPACKKAAIHVVEDDSDLSEDEQQKAYKIIRLDTSFADTILAIRKPAARTRFIKEELYSETEL